MPTVPSLAEIREWISVPSSVFTDAQLQLVVDSELAIQASLCRIPADPDAYPAQAVAGLLRRVGRVVAARPLHLGMVSTDSEFGPVRLPATDAEILRVEASIRRLDVLA